MSKIDSNVSDGGLKVSEFKKELTEHAPVTLERDDFDDDIDSMSESETFKQTSKNKRGAKSQRV